MAPGPSPEASWLQGLVLRPQGPGHETEASELVPRFHELILRYCIYLTLYLSTPSHLDRCPGHPLRNGHCGVEERGVQGERGYLPGGSYRAI